jgi:hypothetical protein
MYSDTGGGGMIPAIELNENGYVREPEGEDASIFDYLEAAYGVERAESLTIQMWEDLQKAGHLAYKLTVVSFDDPEGQVYTLSNEIESLVDSVEMELTGDSVKEAARYDRLDEKSQEGKAGE